MGQQLAHAAHDLGVLHDPSLNKGTAFSEDERDRLGLRGLLPPRILTQDQQVAKVLENCRAIGNPLQQHVYMISLQDRNERLFYRVVTDHLDEMMPIIYTPTVGEACERYGHIWRRPRGLFVTARDRGRIASILRNWPNEAVRAIVVTDGERILGLGDLGANGMGIPVGKLSLYTACAGIDPAGCLPIALDVGTENAQLLNDPLYVGLAQRRLPQPEYDAFIDEFMDAVQTVFPEALIQFEDFSNRNAFRILERYRDKACCFNDDIQGTAGVTLAGLFAAIRMLGATRLSSQKLLFLGAGEAGTGIAALVVRALMDEGLSQADARARCWFVDSRGLVVKSRNDLAEHKRPYAHAQEPIGNLLTAVRHLRPSALIGVSGQAQTFDRAVIEAMAAINERPIIFALSNPTSKSECTAAEAYAWSDGRAIFASGSPFAPVEYGGRTYVSGQANNAYVFPGVALGVIACGARRVIDEMFLAAAHTLASEVTGADLRSGSLFPPLKRIRDISLEIASAVGEVAYECNLARVARPPDLPRFIAGQMYTPYY
jgi:malate dehydrogenase (oxaloacetate-decarboxylating)(NADP+)